MTRAYNTSEPQFFVKVEPPKGSKSLGEDITYSVLSFEYEDSEKKTDLLKLSIRNDDLSYFDHPVFQKGTVLTVSWGYPGNMTPPRQCVVQTIKGFTTLTVEAQDKGVLLNKKGVSRTFENVKRSDVAATIATEQGYAVSQRFIDDTAVVYPAIVQAAQTDAQFLKKLADLEGFEFYVDYDGFHWHKRAFDQKPMRVLMYYLPPGVGDILTCSVDNDVSGKPGAVTVAGRNPLEKKDIKVTADPSNTPRTTLSTTPEVVPQPPPVQLVEKVDPRTGTTTAVYAPPPKNPASADSAASSQVRPSSVSDDAQARREAQGVFTRTQQTAVQLSCTMVGDPEIAAKVVLEIQGIGRRLSGKYYLTEVKHTLNASGYLIAFKGKSDGTNGTGARKPAAAKPNTKEADKPAEVPPLQLIEVVNPRTGETKSVYRDPRGKDVK